MPTGRRETELSSEAQGLGRMRPRGRLVRRELGEGRREPACGLDEVAHLAQGDRERLEAGQLAHADVAHDLERSLDARLAGRLPGVDPGLGRKARRRGLERLARESAVDAEELVPEGSAGEGLPAV